MDENRRDKPRSAIGSADEEWQNALADNAMGEIKKVERLSGFGRFIVKVQNLFAHPQASRSRTGRQWRAKPMLVLAAVSLVLTLALLCVLSKPVAKTSRRFRQANSVEGASDDQPLPDTASLLSPPITESQLAGNDNRSAVASDGRTRRRKVAANSSTWAHRRMPKRQAVTRESLSSNSLRTPATVFVNDPTPAGTPRAVEMPRVLSTNTPSPGTMLPRGTEILAHTTNAISTGLESPVIAVVDQDVTLDGSAVIPQGSRAIGSTGGAVRDRVSVKFTSLVFPAGGEIEFSGLALMGDGSAGLVGKAQGSGHRVLAGMARTAAGAGALAAEFAGQTSNTLGQPFSEGDLLRNELGAEIANEGYSAANRLGQPLAMPTVSVPANQRIRIFLLAPMQFENRTLHPVNTSSDVQSPPSTSPRPTGHGEDKGQLQSAVEMRSAYIQALEAEITRLQAAISQDRQTY
jgi:hypothetical protein